MQVFDLGKNGQDAAKRVADMNDLLSSATYAIGETKPYIFAECLLKMDKMK